jgi:hypothetical protein
MSFRVGAVEGSTPLPTGGHFEQSDSTVWMAMYLLKMLAIVLEPVSKNPVYEDVATKLW